MNQRGGLISNGFHQLGVGMTQAIHRHAGNRIEITLAGLVPQVSALAAHKGNGLTCIGVHQMCCHGSRNQAVLKN